VDAAGGALIAFGCAVGALYYVLIRWPAADLRSGATRIALSSDFAIQMLAYGFYAWLEWQAVSRLLG
jgi:hypothetical protein